MGTRQQRRTFYCLNLVSLQLVLWDSLYGSAQVTLFKAVVGFCISQKDIKERKEAKNDHLS